MEAARSQDLEDDGEVINRANFSHQPKREFLFKILVIGELGCGKTSFIKRYVHQFFSEHYRLEGFQKMKDVLSLCQQIRTVDKNWFA